MLNLFQYPSGTTSFGLEMSRIIRAFNLHFCCGMIWLLGASSVTALQAPTCNSALCDNDRQHLELFTISFYRWYIDKTFIQNYSMLDRAVGLKKFVTQKLFHELNQKWADPDLDSDPVTYSQDYNDTWLFPIAHVKRFHENRDACVELIFNQPPLPPHELRVFLKVERGHWLIDRIQRNERCSSQ